MEARELTPCEVTSMSELKSIHRISHWCSVMDGAWIREKGVKSIASKPVADLQAVPAQGTRPSDLGK